MSNENPLEHILSCLEGVEETPEGSYKALCPAHDDHDPSLSVTEGEDHKPLVHCFVCKDQEKVWRALEERGIARSDLFHRNGEGRGRNGSKKPKRRMCLTGVYDYKTPDGEFVRHHSLRFEPPTKDEQHHPKCRGEHCHSNRKDKDFRQARPNSGSSGYVYGLDGVQTVPYNLRDVMRTALDGGEVVWVEGEKDADNGKERLGLTTTTCPMGAKHFKPYYAGYFTGARVVVVADNDAPGREHAEMVARELLPFAASVKILKLPDLPESGDLTDWINADGTREKFDALVEEAEEFDSGHIGEEFGRNEFLPVKSVSEILAESEEGADWMVNPLLAKGNITDLSGEAKFSGKTTWAMHMIARLLKGEDFMGFPTRKSKVLYLTEQGNNFAEALQKAGLQDADGELFVVQHRDVRVMPWEQLVSDAVEECVRRGADVLVIDTFAAFSGIVGNEENNSRRHTRQDGAPQESCAGARSRCALHPPRRQERQGAG